MNKSFTNIRGLNKNQTFLNISNNCRTKFPENEVFSKGGKGSSSFENAATMNQTIHPPRMITSGSSSRLLNGSLLTIRGRGRGHNRTMTRHESCSFNSLDKCNSILKISSEMASFCGQSQNSSSSVEIKIINKTNKPSRKIKKKEIPL